jgi:competence protein ComEC
MVLTHEDSDHLGGALSVMEALEVDALASSLAPRHALNALAAAPRRCHAGDAWEWDGVRFAFLHPPREGAGRRRNDRSCVLRVETPYGSMLLTGDIERAAELSIKWPTADVLLVPHHGSRSSSSAELIAAARPRLAIVSAGYRSRFGHPAPEVLERYGAAGIEVLRTDRDGALSVGLNRGGLALRAERRARERYWLQ